MSQVFGLDRDISADLPLLRDLRRRIREGGHLVLQVRAPQPRPDSTTFAWPAPEGWTVIETVKAVPQNGHMLVEHAFDVRAPNQTFSVRASQRVYDQQALADLAALSGFDVQDVLMLRSGEVVDSSPEDLLVVLVARRDWNFVSDLTSFLAAWADPAHTRNRRPGHLVSTADGRLTNHDQAAAGEGDALTRHHPDFGASVEPGVLPLVHALVEDWNLITYSSCEGHVGATGGTFSQRYVGLAALDEQDAARQALLLRTACAAADTDGAAAPTVRLRRLHGPGVNLPAVDLVLSRRPGTTWSAYRAACDEVTRLVAQELASLRAGAAQAHGR